MNKFYFLAVTLLFLSVSLEAQDKKWSVEANFPISVGDELGNDVTGIMDIGVKYRFLDFSIVKIGAGINAGYFKENISSQTDIDATDFDETNWIIQPKVFAEFKISALSKLHPSIGLGYTIIKSKDEGTFVGLGMDESFSSGGLNINLGLAYDISKRFFLQAQYDYISNKYDEVDFKQDLGYLKLGVGFRF